MISRRNFLKMCGGMGAAAALASVSSNPGEAMMVMNSFDITLTGKTVEVEKVFLTRYEHEIIIPFGQTWNVDFKIVYSDVAGGYAGMFYGGGLFQHLDWNFLATDWDGPSLSRAHLGAAMEAVNCQLKPEGSKLRVYAKGEEGRTLLWTAKISVIVVS